jgi:hypothetical protein
MHQYFHVVREASWSDVQLINATESLEYLFASGWKGRISRGRGSPRLKCIILEAKR